MVTGPRSESRRHYLIRRNTNAIHMIFLKYKLTIKENYRLTGLVALGFHSVDKSTNYLHHNLTYYYTALSIHGNIMHYTIRLSVCPRALVTLKRKVQISKQGPQPLWKRSCHIGQKVIGQGHNINYFLPVCMSYRGWLLKNEITKKVQFCALVVGSGVVHRPHRSRWSGL